MQATKLNADVSVKLEVGALVTGRAAPEKKKARWPLMLGAFAVGVAVMGGQAAAVAFVTSQIAARNRRRRH